MKKQLATAALALTATFAPIAANSNTQPEGENDNKTEVVKADPTKNLDIHDLTQHEWGEDDPHTYSARHDKMVVILAGSNKDEVMQEAVASFDRFTNIRVYTLIGDECHSGAEFILDGYNLTFKGKDEWPLITGQSENARAYIERKNREVHNIPADVQPGFVTAGLY